MCVPREHLLSYRHAAVVMHAGIATPPLISYACRDLYPPPIGHACRDRYPTGIPGLGSARSSPVHASSERPQQQQPPPPCIHTIA